MSTQLIEQIFFDFAPMNLFHQHVENKFEIYYRHNCVNLFMQTQIHILIIIYAIFIVYI